VRSRAAPSGIVLVLVVVLVLDPKTADDEYECDDEYDCLAVGQQTGANQKSAAPGAIPVGGEGLGRR